MSAFEFGCSPFKYALVWTLIVAAFLCWLVLEKVKNIVSCSHEAETTGHDSPELGSIAYRRPCSNEAHWIDCLDHIHTLNDEKVTKLSTTDQLLVRCVAKGCECLWLNSTIDYRRLPLWHSSEARDVVQFPVAWVEYSEHAFASNNNGSCASWHE